LCVANITITSYHDTAGENVYTLDLESTLKWIRGNALTIFNFGAEEIRITFNDNRSFTEWSFAAADFALDTVEGNGPPFVNIKPQECVSVETRKSDDTVGKKGVFINILEKDNSGIWKGKRGGGNGPDMEMDDP
jgi:hypothetical protein